jgi:protein-disulfide isomerase
MSIRHLVFAAALTATLAAAQSTPEFKALQAKVDSVAAELQMLERVLKLRGLDVELGRRQIARQDSTYDIPVAGTPIWGDPKAPVTLVLFTDLQCPYCAKMLPVVKQMQERSPKALKISFRHYPLVSIHDKALNAHQALWAAGKQGKFWEYFFRTTPEFRTLSDSTLLAAARELKLDLVRFEADRKSEAARKAIEADLALGAKVGVEGTPALFLNGKPTRNPDDIEAAIAKAEGR